MTLFFHKLHSCVTMTLRTMMLPAMLLMLGSCGLINDPDTPDDDKGDISIKFRVSTIASIGNHGNTRADDKKHDEVPSSIPQIEDMINTEDFAFYIFLGAEDNAKLIYSCSDFSKPGSASINGSLGFYDINVLLTNKEIREYFGDNQDPDSPVKFRIITLANTKVITNGKFPSESMTGLTYSEIINKAKELTFSIDKNIYNPDGGNITDKVKAYLPMFGMNVFTTTLGRLLEARFENPIHLGDIDMLRAVSKVRLIDNITRIEGTQYPRITSAEFALDRSNGYVLPDQYESYINGNQVHTARLTNAETTPSRIPFILNDGNQKEVEYFTYCPEQTISGDTGRPAFYITIAYDDNVANNKTYEVSMTGYQGTAFDWSGDYLLRNHIYTLRVDGLTLDRELILTVCPRADFTTDVPTFE